MEDDMCAHTPQRSEGMGATGAAGTGSSGFWEPTLKEQQVLLRSEPSLRLLPMFLVFSTASGWDGGS